MNVLYFNGNSFYLVSNTHLVKLFTSKETDTQNSSVQACGIDAEHAIKTAPCGEYGLHSEVKCKFLIVIWNKPLPPSWSIPDN